MRRHLPSWRNPLLWISIVSIIAVVLIILGLLSSRGL